MWRYLSQLLQPCGLFNPCPLNTIRAQGLPMGPMTTEFVPLNNCTTSLFWCDSVWSIPNWQSRPLTKSFLFQCIFKLWNTSNMLEKIDTNPCPTQMWWNLTLCEDSQQDSKASSETVSWGEGGGLGLWREFWHWLWGPQTQLYSRHKITIIYVLCAFILTGSPLPFQPLSVESPEFCPQDSSLSALIPGECHLVSGHLASSNTQMTPCFCLASASLLIHWYHTIS